MNNKKLTLAIDFDGTITKESSYPELGEVNPNAIKYINKLHKEGYFIIINTCRSGSKFEEAKSFLYRYGIKHHLINENDPERIKKYGTDTRKISADIYIDDNNLGKMFTWKKIYRLIHKQTNE